MGHDHGHDRPHAHDLGLSHDLPLIGRRRLLGLLGGAGLAAAAGCAGPSSAGSGRSSSAGTSAAATTSGQEIPEETGGPYPADGSNGVNVLDDSGVVRSDLRASFGGASGVAEGVPLTVVLTVLDVSEGGEPLEGAAVYLWHCDRDGRYSMYDDEVADENYLRGVQAADADGRVSFTTIFPAAYAGRWPHAHFEVYPSLADATAASNRLRTSQLALPQDVCADVYATDGYEQSVRNLASTSLETDMVFADGYSLQLAKVSGDVEGGYTATLAVPV